MKTILILAAMLAHHADDFTAEIAEAIDHVCAGDPACQLDAVATCWVETRCRGRDKCGRNGCGPFQQVRRYTTHPRLEGLSYAEKTKILGADAVVAAEQWRLKRDKLKKRFGGVWPKHYNGSENKDQYLEKWKRARAWAASLRRGHSTD